MLGHIFLPYSTQGPDYPQPPVGSQALCGTELLSRPAPVIWNDSPDACVVCRDLWLLQSDRRLKAMLGEAVA